MRKDRKDQRKTPILKRITKKWAGILSVTVLALSVSGAVWYGIARANEGDTSNAESSTTVRSLQNGSFEDFPKNTGTNQFTQDQVPFWNTTATDEKIEIFHENTNYIDHVTLKPTAGDYAAELNAEEESTLYQNVNTTPSSVYEWGLDHGARSSKDTMALVIGPKQEIKPSKPNRGGRDQLMQMIDWFKQKENISNSMVPQQYTIYSKKFAENGKFQDNAGDNAFSFTSSKIYTEKWQIWIMADGCETSGTNPWGHYGSNAEGSAGNTDEAGNTQLDMNKYYLYKVPEGQTETMFGFVSVDTSSYKTYGNFLDNVNFQLYHPLSGSTTTHGSAIIGASDGSTDSEGASKGHKVTANKNVETYVTDGQPLKIQAILEKKDAQAGCSFVGVYYKQQDDKGQKTTTFLKRAGNEIDVKDAENKTDAEKKDKWIVSENDNGDKIYTYYLDKVTAAVDLQFIFIKSPTVTYDSNGGKPYVVDRQYNTDEAPNVYSFKPSQTGETLEFIPPYASKAAEGLTKDWKFTGWQLTGDQVDGIPTDIDLVEEDKVGYKLLPAEHTIVCNYSINGATGNNAAQYFKIFPGSVAKSDFTENINKDSNNAVSGVQWTKNENDDKYHRSYANVHRGLTMVAQWRWNQKFIPQLKSTSGYEDSNAGGTITISGVESDKDNYTDNYNSKGGKSYYASTNENISVTAKPNEEKGCVFEGWYDEKGNLLTTNETYSYTETAESVNTYYAKFSGGVTQNYIRQVKKGNDWENTTDDTIGTLGRYTYTDAIGTFVSSTASARTGYKFVGWYDSNSEKVADTMLGNSGKTLQYFTTTNATYYARFEKTYTVNFVSQTKQTNGKFSNDGNGGKVSTSSAEGVEGESVKSTATANNGYKFVGWYGGEDGTTLLSSEATYSPKTGTATNNQTYYARFEIDYSPSVEEQVYLSFIAESEKVSIPSIFDNRTAGTNKGSSTEDYGLDRKYGNTIATGFKYSVGNVTGINTIQITVEIPADSSYIKTSSNSFSGDGTAILKDGSGVTYNRGEIQKINQTTIKKYYWEVTEIQANKSYGFIIDNLYAPKATATITVNGTEGTKVTNSNGVVNASATEYKGKSHYSK